MIQEEIAERFAVHLQKELQWELISDMAVATGWTRAEIVPFSRPKLQRAVLNWVQTNVQGRYENFETRYVFEKASDATLFVLKWSHVLYQA
jgi:hypothetical protein